MSVSQANRTTTVDSSSLEPTIKQIGQALSKRFAGHAPSVFDRRWWSQTLLDWSMKDDRFKVRLFRFIDVLPTLRQDAQVARLVEEYFADLPTLTAPLQWGMRTLSATKLGARFSAHSLRRQIEHMAKTFIAGETVTQAAPLLRQLWQSGRGYSIDLLGEACVSEVEADRYRDRCLDALTTLQRLSNAWPAATLLERDHLGPLPRVHLSVKLSALYSQLDPIDPDGAYRATAARLRPLLDLAQTIPAALTFDMEQAELKDLILTIFMRLLSEPTYRAYPHGGIALQAYLKDAATGLDRLIQWAGRREAPVTIRLVKGAYWDSEMIRYEQQGWPLPVFQRKAETDLNYEILTRTLINHADRVRPVFGTHNVRSLAHAEAAADAAGLPPEAREYQMIFGMAEALQASVAQYGRRVRVYTPIGELIPGMAYLVRRLLENTSNESFLRKAYAGTEPLDALLSAPTPSTDPPLRTTAAATDRFRNEPHTDFSGAAARNDMTQALAEVSRHCGRRFSSTLPGGGPSGPELLSRNPSAPAHVVARVQGCTEADVARAVITALDHFSAWKATSADQRAGMLLDAAAIMRRRRFELAAWEIFETGKPWREADADVAEAIDFLEFYARDMRRLAPPRRLGQEPGELNELFYTPRGVAVVIAPWNFPLAIPTGMVSAALVTGNVVLFKPSERASVMGSLLADVLHQAGVGSGMLQILPGGPEIGRALVTHADVDLVAFTGSKEIGLQIVQHATHVTPQQRALKRIIAEMGGKNAIIVDDTADLDEAVLGVLRSFTGYQGQKCSACSRVIVHEAVYDLFLGRLVEATASLPVGPPENPSHFMGPMIDDRARRKVQDYIEIGKQEGRLVWTRDVPGDGYFVGPAIFADIEASHRLAQEEIFGPVLALMRARSFHDALTVANTSCYALTGGVYSRSPANIQAARSLFDVGNLYINRPITGALVGRQPFGGHRLSGLGAKAGGEDYLTQFMITRVVSENTMRRGFAPLEWER